MLDETQGLGFVRHETHEEETALSHLLVPQHSEAAFPPHRLLPSGEIPTAIGLRCAFTDEPATCLEGLSSGQGGWPIGRSA